MTFLSPSAALWARSPVTSAFFAAPLAPDAAPIIIPASPQETAPLMVPASPQATLPSAAAAPSWVIAPGAPFPLSAYKTEPASNIYQDSFGTSATGAPEYGSDPATWQGVAGDTDPGAFGWENGQYTMTSAKVAVTSALPASVTTQAWYIKANTNFQGAPTNANAAAGVQNALNEANWLDNNTNFGMIAMALNDNSTTQFVGANFALGVAELVAAGDLTLIGGTLTAFGNAGFVTSVASGDIPGVLLSGGAAVAGLGALDLAATAATKSDAEAVEGSILSATDQGLVVIGRKLGDFTAPGLTVKAASPPSLAAFDASFNPGQAFIAAIQKVGNLTPAAQAIYGFKS